MINVSNAPLIPITGGSRGVGAATARLAAARGYDVAISYVTNESAALRRDDIGVIAPGMRADLVLLDAPSRVHLAYRPGVPLVRTVWIGGRETQPRGR